MKFPSGLLLIAALLTAGCGDSDSGSTASGGATGQAASGGSSTSNGGSGTKTPGPQPAPGAAGDDSSDTEQLKARIQDMIQVVAKGDPRETFKQLLPPRQYAEIMKGGNIEADIASFQEQKAPDLLESLKKLDVSAAEINGDEVTFPTKPRPMRFIRVDGKWYLMN